ncbi:hypothetical protein CYY_001638 [Polysphondylium violaceum]|uniref:Zinc finger PHD-type domain-containing protein n=1 Tax=Polysphondylium violaceum TaxID=133409 RepID=A0A8J4UW15_9MYCE|nr:hypothetical protein CYY_001638 [Polysphondylium violaceum]
MDNILFNPFEKDSSSILLQSASFPNVMVVPNPSGSSDDVMSCFSQTTCNNNHINNNSNSSNSLNIYTNSTPNNVDEFLSNSDNDLIDSNIGSTGSSVSSSVTSSPTSIICNNNSNNNILPNSHPELVFNNQSQFPIQNMPGVVYYPNSISTTTNTTNIYLTNNTNSNNTIVQPTITIPTSTTTIFPQTYFPPNTISPTPTPFLVQNNLVPNNNNNNNNNSQQVQQQQQRPPMITINNNNNDTLPEYERHIDSLIKTLPSNSNSLIDLFLHLSDQQENLYRSLLKDNIPKMASSPDQTKFLYDLYLQLMNCCNQAFNNSCKMLAFQKLIDHLSTTNAIRPNVFIVVYNTPFLLNIFKDYLSKKSFLFKVLENSQNISKEELKNNFILLTSRDNFNSLDLINSNHNREIFLNYDVSIVEFDSFWMNQQFPLIPSIPSIITASGFKTFRLLTLGTVEEWLFNKVNNSNSNNNGNNQHQQQQQHNLSTSTSSTPSSPSSPSLPPLSPNTISADQSKEIMVEMMKFCIVKLSNLKKSASPTPSSTPTPISSPPSMAPSSSPLLFSQFQQKSISLNSSSNSSSSINNNPASILNSKSISFSESPLWKSSTSPIGLSTSFDSNSSSGSNGPPTIHLKTSEDKKKSRSSKKLKSMVNRCCFSCKKEEDSKGRTSMVQCRSCPKIYHRSCAGLSHTPRSWKCTRHTCHQCKKTPNESGGSFFICKGCPSSYCITCLPNGVKILDKAEYTEYKPNTPEATAAYYINPNSNNNNNSTDSDDGLQTSPSPSRPVPIGSVSSSSSSPALLESSFMQNQPPLLQQLHKKQKVQRPTVFILCEVCIKTESSNPPTTTTGVIATSTTNNSSLPTTTTTTTIGNSNNNNNITLMTPPLQNNNIVPNTNTTSQPLPINPNTMVSQHPISYHYQQQPPPQQQYLHQQYHNPNMVYPHTIAYPIMNSNHHHHHHNNMPLNLESPSSSSDSSPSPQTQSLPNTPSFYLTDSPSEFMNL